MPRTKVPSIPTTMLSSSLISSPSLNSPSSTVLSFTRSLNSPFPKFHEPLHSLTKIPVLSVKAQTLDFSGSFFEGGLGADDDPPISPGSGIAAVEDKEEPQCPPGLRQYETMAVLRPDMSEDERLTLTQKYEEDTAYSVDGVKDTSAEEANFVMSKFVNNVGIPSVKLLVAGGGMYVEVFNRGVIPLAYSIRKKNKAGETNTYLDGIYLLFTYFTKPESMEVLESTMKADDDVIRSMSFKVRKRKY